MKRRDFFKTVGWVGVSALFLKEVGGRAQVISTPPATQVDPYAPGGFQGLARNPEAYTYFFGQEALFIEAAIQRLWPRDDSGAGALEAGVSYFIDQQLAGSFGTGATWYMHGPWATGTPMQGYQLQFTPAEVYRAGISAANKYARDKFGKTFDALSTSQQDSVLTDLELGKVDSPDVPKAVTAQFFSFLLQNTIEGVFADPAYGGNRNKVGWQQIGYPGVYLETYADFIDQPNAQLPKINYMGLADAQSPKNVS